LRFRLQPYLCHRFSKVHCISGPVVQLVRMPPCHGGDRGFESRPDRLQQKCKKGLISPFCILFPPHPEPSPASQTSMQVIIHYYLYHRHSQPIPKISNLIQKGHHPGVRNLSLSHPCLPAKSSMNPLSLQPFCTIKEINHFSHAVRTRTPTQRIP
jgi:hypothetical protein